MSLTVYHKKLKQKFLSPLLPLSLARDIPLGYDALQIGPKLLDGVLEQILTRLTKVLAEPIEPSPIIQSSCTNTKFNNLFADRLKHHLRVICWPLFLRLLTLHAQYQTTTPQPQSYRP